MSLEALAQQRLALLLRRGFRQCLLLRLCDCLQSTSTRFPRTLLIERHTGAQPKLLDRTDRTLQSPAAADPMAW